MRWAGKRRRREAMNRTMHAYNIIHAYPFYTPSPLPLHSFSTPSPLLLHSFSTPSPLTSCSFCPPSFSLSPPVSGAWSMSSRPLARRVQQAMGGACHTHPALPIPSPIHHLVTTHPPPIFRWAAASPPSPLAGYAPCGTGATECGAGERETSNHTGRYHTRCHTPTRTLLARMFLLRLTLL
jgi:hypothetical protein